MSVLSLEERNRFVEQGFCMLRAAFTARDAERARAVIWRRMYEKAGINQGDASTWPAAYDIEEHVQDPAILACFSDRLAQGITELLGPERWTGVRSWGFWPVNFSYGCDAHAPWPNSSWHIDGNWFRHSLTCPRQGLLVIGLFNDVAPGHGGTVVARGSHKRTARVLAAHPEGLTHLELFNEVLAEPIGNFCELTGATGDVVLAHPFLFHSRGYKRAGVPRMISNTEAPLHRPLELERAAGDYSVLEESIRRALLDPLPATPLDAMRCRF